MAEATPDIEQLTSDYVAAWNGDFSKLEVVSESVDIYSPGVPEGEVHGRDAFEAYLRELQTGFPDFHLTINEKTISEDGIMWEWTVTGTHEGEFNGLPPTEREVEIAGMSNVLIVDGKIQEARIYWDRQEMVDQLGLSFPTVLGQLPELAWRKLRATL